MKRFKQVTKEVFEKFIKDYPNIISWDTCGIFDPPQTMAHDFTLYKGWDAVIAYIIKYTLHPLHEGSQDIYHIQCDRK